MRKNIFFRLKNDEEGQSLVFTALILLVLVAFTLTVLDVGHVVTRKIQAQTAADASALSGAIMQARVINTLCYLNIGIVACYISMGLIITAWVGVCVASLIPVVGLAFAAACGHFSTFGPKAIKSLYKFAKKISNLEESIVQNAKFVVLAEMFRIGQLNLSNAREQGSSFENIDVADIRNKLTLKKGVGAVGIDGNEKIPPDISYGVEKGSISNLLKNFLPSPFNKIIKDPQNVSHTAARTYKETTQVKKTRYKIKDFKVNKYTKTVTKIKDKKVQSTASETLGDGPGDKPPAPYILKPDEWKTVSKMCALAYRFERKEAVTEKLVKGNKMIPPNYTFAEAEVYYDGERNSKSSTLFNPRWDARLKPLSLHETLLSKYNISTGMSNGLFVH